MAVMNVPVLWIFFWGRDMCPYGKHSLGNFASRTTFCQPWDWGGTGHGRETMMLWWFLTTGLPKWCSSADSAWSLFRTSHYQFDFQP